MRAGKAVVMAVVQSFESEHTNGTQNSLLVTESNPPHSFCEATVLTNAST